MGAYESLVNLYRVFCQPTSFLAEARGLPLVRRLVFMLRMAPVMVITAAVTVGTLSLFLQTFGMLVHWKPQGVWWEPALASVAYGIGVGTLWNVSAGVAFGVVWGPAQWLIVEVILPVVHFIPEDVKVSIGNGAPLGLAAGVALGIAAGTARTAVWGLILGIGFGVLMGGAGRLSGALALMAFFFFGYFRLEWYAVDIEMTLVQLIRAYHRPARAVAFLRGSPIYWREPIWPPLLGLRSFLCLVGDHSYAEGIDACLFIISERPTQAAIARTALMQIVTRRLARLDSVQQIAAASGEVERPMAGGVQLPETLQKSLPELEELTRFAEQHLTATLPYNRKRALYRLRDGADDLARRLALESGLVPRLLLVVTRSWRGVAEAELAKMGEAEKAAGFVHNPFVFGQPIEETETNLFVGRRDIVREIEVSLLGGTAKPALVLWGPRRMGKTSVLLQLPRLLGSEFVPAFVDVQAMQVRESVGAFFQSVTASASAALRRRGVPSAALTAADIGDSPFTAFAGWLATVEERLGPGRHLLLCLDEFERLETSIREGRLPHELMDQIRHTIQHHARIVVLLAGSHRPDELELNWPDALISTKMIRVSYLAEEEARQLITQPVPDFEISYAAGSVERITEATRCQPYLVQALCYELVNHLNMEGRREASPEDIDIVVGRALESAHLYFAEMWRQLDENQRAILTRLAAAPQPPETRELAAPGSSEEQVDADLRWLAARSIVENPNSGGWRFQVPMVAEWVRARGG